MAGAPRPVNNTVNSKAHPAQTNIITAPLEPSDDAGIAEVAQAFVGLPCPPIETVCAEQKQKSRFFHLLFSVEPQIPGKAAENWKICAEESVARHVRNNCEEGVLVQAVHTNTLRLEDAIRFSVEKREGKFVRQNLKTQTLLKSGQWSTGGAAIHKKIIVLIR